jgi:superfamily II DNA helicase RecQ
LIPAYERFKRSYPTYSYGNFVKTDSYYYNYIVPAIVNYLKEYKDKFNFADIFDFSKSTSVIIDRKTSFDNYKPGLEEELKEFRLRTSKNAGIPAYEVFKNTQMVSIIRYRVRTLDDLKQKAKLSSMQIEKFGDSICKIVSKYADISDYKSE